MQLGPHHAWWDELHTHIFDVFYELDYSYCSLGCCNISLFVYTVILFHCKVKVMQLGMHLHVFPRNAYTPIIIENRCSQITPSLSMLNSMKTEFYDTTYFKYQTPLLSGEGSYSVTYPQCPRFGQPKCPNYKGYPHLKRALAYRGIPA